MYAAKRIPVWCVDLTAGWQDKELVSTMLSSPPAA
jgi:hypothetical protein